MKIRDRTPVMIPKRIGFLGKPQVALMAIVAR
jgi:hypothetical protein